MPPSEPFMCLVLSALLVRSLSLPLFGLELKPEVVDRGVLFLNGALNGFNASLGPVPLLDLGLDEEVVGLEKRGFKNGFDEAGLWPSPPGNNVGWGGPVRKFPGPNMAWAGGIGVTPSPVFLAIEDVKSKGLRL